MRAQTHVRRYFLVLDPYIQKLRCYEIFDGSMEVGSMAAELNVRQCKVRVCDTDAGTTEAGSYFVVSNNWEELYLCASSAQVQALWVQALQLVRIGVTESGTSAPGLPPSRDCARSARCTRSVAQVRLHLVRHPHLHADVFGQQRAGLS